ncbi:MAG TPA: bacteriohopanetetrol glucosamine biosynthesis glycosyltransferase HpnI [Gammaproteobacteria bacterium]|nr:bacteriohopanetetrol glucosamine biosynthesis glycosyltransferase HpnI [Gammaproteobacteria bacterium]
MTLPWLVVGYALCAAAVTYQAVALWAHWRWNRRIGRTGSGPRPVTLLKPLFGDEPRLYENLRSFCEQDHPCFQVVFGVCREDDPALRVVRRLQAEFPALDIAVVAAPPGGSENHKVANLMNMLPRAAHDWLVIADSDIRVGRDYLRTVTAPLAERRTGVVTCLYQGRAMPGLWSRLAALFINDWFLPSVLVSHACGSRAFAFGATLALRRDVLDAIGGLGRLANELADDYRLAELTREAGFDTVLSSYRVETLVHEPTLLCLWRHELRWARTIRMLRPVGYAFTFVTYSLPLAALGALCTGLAAGGVGLLGATVALRLGVHYAGGTGGRNLLSTSTFIAARDLLSLLVWCAAFFGYTVWWQGRLLVLRPGGSVCEHTGRRS